MPLLTRNGADLNNDGHFTAEELATLTVLRCTTEDCTANSYDVNYGAAWDVISICPNITEIEVTITEINSDYETGGKAYWLSLLSSGVSKLEIINSFIETPEWVSVCKEYGIRSGATIEDSVPQADVGDFIERLYQNILGRHSDEGGMQSWRQAAASGATGADIASGFLYSPEFLNKPISNAEFIQILYRVFFDREADVCATYGIPSGGTGV